MDKPAPVFARHAFVFALACTTGLGVAAFIARPAASMLGRDVSQLASGVIGFYPGAAAAEAAKVFGVVFAVSFIVGLGALAVRALSSGPWRWFFPAAPLCAYGLWLLAAMVKYPALFSEVLTETGRRQLFRLSGVLSPNSLVGAALTILLAPALIALIRSERNRSQRIRRARAMVAGGVVAVIFLAGVNFEPPWPGKHDAKGSPRPVNQAGALPNVLVIGVDSLRTDRLPSATITPHLSALMADPQSVAFNDHWVGVPRTFPSWIELLTGNYAPRNGIRHMFPGFGERKEPFVGLVSALRGRGYQTGVVSDFAGDIFPRFQAGFKRILAPKLTLKTMIRLSVDQSLWTVLPFLTMGPTRHLFQDLKESPVFGDPEHLTAAVRSLIADFSTSLGGVQPQPWLATVFFSTAHFPYAAPYPYYRLFSAPSYDGSFRFQKNPDASHDASGLAEAEVHQVRALYDGAVRAVDDQIGALIADIKSRGLWDETLVVITADHGEDLYEDGRLQGHGEHLRGENVQRVPFIMKLPLGVRPNIREVPFTTRSIDVAATVLGAAGVGGGSGEGTDLMPWISGKAGGAPALAAYGETEIWFNRHGAGFFQQQRLDYPGISGLLSFDQGYTGEIVLNPIYQSIIVTAKHRMWLEGDFKLLYVPTPDGVHYELYDRRRDPANLNNIAESHGAQLSRLKSSLLAFIAREEGAHAQIVSDYVVPQ